MAAKSVEEVMVKTYKLPQNKNIRFVFEEKGPQLIPVGNGETRWSFNNPVIHIFSYKNKKIYWELKISNQEFCLNFNTSDYPSSEYFKDLLEISWPDDSYQVIAKRLVKEKGGFTKMEVKKMKSLEERKQDFVKGLEFYFSVSKLGLKTIKSLLFRTEYLLSDSKETAKSIGGSDLFHTAAYCFVGDKVYLRFYY